MVAQFQFGAIFLILEAVVAYPTTTQINKVDQIDNCTKDTTTHLNRLHSIDVSSANFPKGLLNLNRSGVFSVDRAAECVNLSMAQRLFGNLLA
jgi:hypothetical protein